MKRSRIAESDWRSVLKLQHSTAIWRHVTVTDTGETWYPHQNADYAAIDKILTLENITIKWAISFLLSKFVLIFFFPHFLFWLFLPTHYRRTGLLTHLIKLNHIYTYTKSVGHLWTRDWPVAETFAWQYTTNIKKQTSIPPGGFEPAIPTIQRLQSYALDLATTGTGWYFISRCEIYESVNICANV